jgi:hypothetical protein
MYIFYILSLFLVISGYVASTSTSESSDSLIFDGKVAAAQMYQYHKAAVDYCEANVGFCSTARLIPNNSVKSMMPVLAQRAPSYNNVYDAGDYESYTTGSGAVATAYMTRNVVSNQSGFHEGSRAMVQELIRIAPTYWPAGRYDRGLQRLTAISGKVITVPRVISGQSLADQVPMLATEF